MSVLRGTRCPEAGGRVVAVRCILPKPWEKGALFSLGKSVPACFLLTASSPELEPSSTLS